MFEFVVTVYGGTYASQEFPVPGMSNDEGTFWEPTSTVYNTVPFYLLNYEDVELTNE